ncbi:MAG: GyrI-like domain-containing protein [Coriobacteriia bacterium]|nr:GyrI-like domain-containing protein [Coriobacteriia bacterium]
MIDVEIKTTEAVTVAYLPMRGAYAQMPEAMGRLYGWVAQHGMQPTGMPTAVYYTAPDEGPEAEALWELQAPIAGEVAEVQPDEDGCGVRRLESQLVASTVYRGPYEGIAPTYEELGRWIVANRYAPSGAPSESYLSDPQDTPPEEYLTEVRFPVAAVGS